MKEQRIKDMAKDKVMKIVREEADKFLSQILPLIKKRLKKANTSLELLSIYVALLGAIRSVSDTLMMTDESDLNLKKIVHSGLLTLEMNITDMIRDLKKDSPEVMEDTDFQEINLKEDAQ